MTHERGDRHAAADLRFRELELCQSTDTPSPSLLNHLLRGEGGAAERQNSRRRPTFGSENSCSSRACRQRVALALILAAGGTVILLHPPLALNLALKYAL